MSDFSCLRRVSLILGGKPQAQQVLRRLPLGETSDDMVLTNQYNGRESGDHGESGTTIFSLYACLTW